MWFTYRQKKKKSNFDYFYLQCEPLVVCIAFICRMRSEYVSIRSAWLPDWRATKRVLCRLTRSGTADILTLTFNINL